MQITNAHKKLADMLIFQHRIKEFHTPDSLVELVAFTFTEEEAIVTTAVNFRPSHAKMVAKRLKRPLHEVKPILKTLADRVLIGSMPIKNVMFYTMLPLVPGVFESQILLNRDKDTEYTREFARLFENFYEELGDLIRPVFDGKDVPVVRVIPIEQTIRSQPELNVVAFSTDKYMEMVDRNSSFCLLDCPCRTTSELLENPCKKPKDVCSGMGIVADIAIEKGMARRATKEEFLDAKARAAEAGLVNVVDNLVDPLQVCSCCACCCVGLRLANKYNVPALIAKSHFESVIDEEKCNGCGLCVDACPMYALSLSDDKCHIDYTRCIGCGICVDKCARKSISLKERKGYQPPADNVVTHAMERYMELKGYDKNKILPRATLGVGRLISKYVQPRVSGPDYKQKRYYR